jgi:hypothetical protein
MSASIRFAPAIKLGLAAALGIGAAGVVLAIEADALGTANDGMICRSGYNGALSGSAFKCSKDVFQTLDLSCNRADFPRYVVRAAGSAGTPDGRDICTRGAGSGVVISSTDSVVNLVRGEDYVFAGVADSAVNGKVGELDQQEATALGLQASEVDTAIVGTPLVQPDQGTGSRDRAVIQVRQYTFAIKNGLAVNAARR